VPKHGYANPFITLSPSGPCVIFRSVPTKLSHCLNLNPVHPIIFPSTKANLYECNPGVHKVQAPASHQLHLRPRCVSLEPIWSISPSSGIMKHLASTSDTNTISRPYETSRSFDHCISVYVPLSSSHITLRSSVYIILHMAFLRSSKPLSKPT